MGVQILNKDVSIISSIVGKAKASIGNVGGVTGWAGGFQPGDFNFNDVSYSVEIGYEITNTVTFTKSGRLYISAPTSTNVAMIADSILNGDYFYFYDNAVDALANPNGFGPFTPFGNDCYAVRDVTIGDTLYFVISAADVVADTGTVTFRADSFTGPIIDSFTATQTL